MKMTSRKYWVAAAVGFAVVVGVFDWRAPRLVPIQVVDADTRTAISDVKVSVLDCYKVPLISSWSFLPEWVRQPSKSHQFSAKDGRILVKRSFTHDVQ